MFYKKGYAQSANVVGFTFSGLNYFVKDHEGEVMWCKFYITVCKIPIHALVHSTQDIFIPFILCALLAIILFHPKTFFIKIVLQ